MRFQGTVAPSWFASVSKEVTASGNSNLPLTMLNCNHALLYLINVWNVGKLGQIAELVTRMMPFVSVLYFYGIL